MSSEKHKGWDPPGYRRPAWNNGEEKGRPDKAHGRVSEEVVLVPKATKHTNMKVHMMV